MSVCTKNHFRQEGKKLVEVPHYYIAGCCIQDPCHQGPYESFLRSFYPYYHGATYHESRFQKSVIISDHPVPVATTSFDLIL